MLDVLSYHHFNGHVLGFISKSGLHVPLLVGFSVEVLGHVYHLSEQEVTVSDFLWRLFDLFISLACQVDQSFFSFWMNALYLGIQVLEIWMHAHIIINVAELLDFSTDSLQLLSVAWYLLLGLGTLVNMRLRISLLLHFKLSILLCSEVWIHLWPLLWIESLGLTNFLRVLSHHLNVLHWVLLILQHCLLSHFSLVWSLLLYSIDLVSQCSILHGLLLFAVSHFY